MSKIEVAKTIASEISTDVAKIASEISQSVAMGAKAYTLVRLADIITTTLCVLAFIVLLGYLLNKYLVRAFKIEDDKVRIRELEINLERERYAKRGY